MSTRKRVLLMSQLLTEGGSERQTSIVARELDRSVYEPFVGCLRAGGIRYEELQNLGIPVEEFRVDSFYNPPPLRAAAKLFRYLQRERIDLIHTFDVPSTILAIPVAAAARTPFILSSQRAHRALTKGMHLHILRLTDRMVDGIVVNSQAVQRELVENEKLPASMIHLCHNALDTSYFQPPAARPSSPVTIGGIGVFRTEKGHRLLIDAFARVHQLEPATRLNIVGGGPLHDDLVARVRELKIEDAVVIEPSTRDVRDRLHAMHLFVLPSFSEALSNALLEAMACGCCALATRVGGNPEILTHEVTGEMFTPGDVSELTTRLLRLVRDRAQREAYGAAAACDIRERFSLNASVRRMEQIYRRIMSRE